MNLQLTRFVIGGAVMGIATLASVGVYAISQHSSSLMDRFVAHAAQDGQGAPGAPARPFGGRGRFGGPGGPGRMGPGGPLDLALGRLNLTDAQRDQVKSIVDSHREETRALLERERPAREALEQAIAAEPVNEATILARNSELAAVQADLAVLRARVRAEVMQVLTPEQRAQTKEMEQQRQSRRRGPQGGAAR
jgi:protein CpxP